MESLVIQLGVKHGRVAELARSKDGVLRVGRSFDNDLVLTDLHVAPRQVEFLREGDEWFMTALDRTNPVLLNGAEVGAEAERIESGDKITIGRTSLTLYSADHPVEKTRELVWSSWLHRRSRGFVLPFLALLVYSLVDSSMEFYQSSLDLEWKEYGYAALLGGIFVVIWAGLWSLAGRLLRHQQVFGLQLMATSLVCLGLSILSPVGSYLTFAFNSDAIGEIAGYVIGFVVLAALLRFNLYFATNIRKTSMVSAVASLLVIGVYYALVNFEQTTDFSTRPVYSTVMKPPFARIGSGQSIETYFQELKDEVELLREFEEED